MTMLEVGATGYQWFPKDGNPRGPMRVELGGFHGVHFALGDGEPLGWLGDVRVTLDPERDFALIEVMGLLFRLVKLPDTATTVLDRCTWCDVPILKRRGEGFHRHILAAESTPAKRYPRLCHPGQKGSQVATPRNLAGLVLVDVPTEETSSVPLRETHAGQYVVMP